MSTTPILDRREFLKKSAATGVALVVGLHLNAQAATERAESQEKPVVNPLNAWVRITPDNRITLILAKSEMGQGVLTSLPMILAEELCVDWKAVKVEQAPTNPKLYDLGTGGSGSVADSWLPLRRAGAAAREMLIEAAAKKWEVSPDTCTAVDGCVVHGHPKRYLKYGDLVEEAAKLPVPNLNTVPLKNSNDFLIIGRDERRIEARAKATGAAMFGIDSRVPGMLYAVVARCPVFEGMVASFDARKAKAIPGVGEVVQFETKAHGASTTGGIAVLADNSWAAIQGRNALEVKWNEGAAASESSAQLQQQFVANAAKPGKIVRNDGDAESALNVSARRIEVAYELPLAPHACMEPMNCTVRIGKDSAEAWVPTQAPQWAQSVIAEAAKLPPEKVVVHTTLMGGGFGRRYQADFVMEAAQIAKAVDKPVMVLWTREDDMQHDFYRPASYHKMQGALDANGTLAAWKHFQTSTAIAAKWAQSGEKQTWVGEFGTGATIPYATPNFRVEYTLAESSVPRAWWRSVEHSSSGFVVESFVDELAAAAGEDPLAFRLKLIGGDRKIPVLGSEKEPPLDTARLKGVLKLAAEKAEWGKPLPKGQGRGIATFYSFNSYTAAVAEVSANQGSVKLHRLVYAVDCGRPINPDGICAQVEGAAIYGLSAMLHDAITINGGRIEQANFNDYEMPRINEAPMTEVHVVMSKEEPSGIGEPGLPVVAPAVCNAIYALTGKRIRRLPIRNEDLA
jgi:isoquinoline 1-oxidoreductase subunit beta